MANLVIMSAMGSRGHTDKREKGSNGKLVTTESVQAPAAPTEAPVLPRVSEPPPIERMATPAPAAPEPPPIPQPPLLFEVGWEVCWQLGGIYTVLRTKAATMLE